MNINIRKFTAIAVTAVLILSLSACGGDKHPDPDSDSGKTRKKAKTPAQMVEEKMKEEEKRSERIVKLINFGELPVQDEEKRDALYRTYDGALFIGDSRTEGFRLYSGVQGATFYCAKSLSALKVARGAAIPFDGREMTLEDVLASKKYDKIYISLGLNEMGRPNIEGYVDDYTKIINIIKQKQPDARIFVQALLPVSAARSAKGGIVTNEQIYNYNTSLVKIAEDTGVKYVNPDGPLVDETGALKPEASTDGIHLSAEYCKIWAQYLAQISL